MTRWIDSDLDSDASVSWNELDFPEFLRYFDGFVDNVRLDKPWQVSVRLPNGVGIRQLRWSWKISPIP